MPTRKIFAEAQKRKTIVAEVSTMETATCQNGGVETSTRMNIVIGVKRGTIEIIVAIRESGLSRIGVSRNHGVMTISMAGAVAAWASFSEFAIDPPTA